jgi:hypothetical protein
MIAFLLTVHLSTDPGHTYQRRDRNQYCRGCAWSQGYAFFPGETKIK